MQVDKKLIEELLGIVVSVGEEVPPADDEADGRLTFILGDLTAIFTLQGTKRIFEGLTFEAAGLSVLVSEELEFLLAMKTGGRDPEVLQVTDETMHLSLETYLHWRLDMAQTLSL